MSRNVLGVDVLAGQLQPGQANRLKKRIQRHLFEAYAVPFHVLGHVFSALPKQASDGGPFGLVDHGNFALTAVAIPDLHRVLLIRGAS